MCRRIQPEETTLWSTPILPFQPFHTAKVALIMSDENKIICNGNASNQQINIIYWCTALTKCSVKVSRLMNGFSR